MPAPPAVDALTHRCQVICRGLGLEPAVGSSFIAGVKAVTDSLRPAAVDDRADQTLAYLLSLAYFGRVADPAESVQIGQLVSSASPEAIDQTLRSWPACREMTGKNRFLPTDPDTTYVDVSHTLFLRRNSGIQRVVRKLAAALATSDHRHVFIRYDGRLKGYRPLTDAERQRLLDWERFGAFDRRTIVDARQKHWLKRQLKQFGRSRYGQPVRRFFRTLRDRSRDIRRGLRQGLFRQGQPASCYFFWQGRLLLPEVIGGDTQLEILTATLAAVPLRSTMILYDLLPISHPECFVRSAVSSFVHYLTLVRHVDQISCISDTVRRQLETLLPAIPRTKPAAHVTAQLLAGDFQTVPGDPPPADSRPAEPIVLCVGTIEPRKNQNRILRAMVVAQESGHTFRGVFAGNAGWLNGQFRQELQAARSRGIQVELHEGISDDALADLYRTARLTVYCSLAEGFGLPVVESVMAGVPCLTSRLGSMQEIADQLGGCSLVNPASTQEIAAAIGRLLAHDAELNALTAEARRAAWHSWQDYCDRLMQFVTTAGGPAAVAPADPPVAAAS